VRRRLHRHSIIRGHFSRKNDRVQSRAAPASPASASLPVSGAQISKIGTVVDPAN
jgi:hypothetical protein